MAESSFPWVGGGVVDAGGWRGRAGTVGDGTMGDATGTAFNPTCTGSDKVVTVAPGIANVQHATYVSTAAVNHNIGAVGSAPSSGQYRWDYIVIRYDATELLVADRVQQVIKPGTPSTTPAFPALTQDPDGVWEHPLISVKRGPGDVSVTSAMIAKVGPWVAQTVYVPGAGELPDGLYDAGIAATYNNLYHRGPDGYTSILDPAWTALTPAAGISQYGPAMQWRIQAGQIHVVGTFRLTAAAFTANAWTAVANLPAAWYTAGLRTGVGGFPPIKPITLTEDFASGQLPVAIQADLMFMLNSGGGVMYVRPRATGGRHGYVDWWLGPIADPRLA